MKHLKRTHTCGELTEKDEGKAVSLNGWVNTRRDHGGLIFIDVRDRYGMTQIVFDPTVSKDAHAKAEHLRREDVLAVKGKVQHRKKDMENAKLKTGMIEVFIDSLEVLNKAETPPIEIDDRVDISEDMRLKYRYLDLRRPKLQHNIIIRHKVAKVTRDFFDKESFLEIETPILAKSTPEGARDYLVPSRVHPGKFYALPQSPQIFKQLCMVAGLDRYFQIARCFRDEDLRADRQPEFTQIDVEMSFIDEEDIYDIMERLIKDIWKKVLNIELKIPFPRMPYEEAMGKYGSDKPDLRFGLPLIDVSEAAKHSDFSVFKSAISSGGSVKCINVKGCGNFSRKELDELSAVATTYDAKGLAWMKMGDKLESSVVKYFNDKAQEEIIKGTHAEKGDLLLFVADHKHHVVNVALGQLRLYLGKKLNLIDIKQWNFSWVVDFPLFEYDEDQQRHMAVHHPFTSPKDEDLAMMDKDPGKVKAKAYDLTLNGVEIGGGSIRIHKRETQKKIFNILGISDTEAEHKFGFLMNAFRYGAPPHGGLAFGLDRIVALITGNESIREVIAFPKTKAAESLMDESPNEVYEEQLRELHIKSDVIKTEHKNIVFEQITKLLDDNSMEYKVMEHEPVHTCEEAAKVRGTQLSQGTKALILRADAKYIMAILPGNKELDIERLKKITQAKILELANAQQVKEVTNCNIGAVPPFGNLFSLETYADNAITQNETIAFNAGSNKKSLQMKVKDLFKLVKPKIQNFSK
jgi:aspartyl-tRNA synthetase